MFYYLSLGTNIHPEFNAIRMVEMLCIRFQEIVVYPFRYTDPVDLSDSEIFLNSIAVIFSKHPETAVKAELNDIEIQLGRDRDDPLRSVKARSADLDILIAAEDFNLERFAEIELPYVQACYRRKGAKPALSSAALSAQQGPAAVHLDTAAGDIFVVDDKFQGFVDRSKAALGSD